jgi:hypothetical protein
MGSLSPTYFLCYFGVPVFSGNRVLLFSWPQLCITSFIHLSLATTPSILSLSMHAPVLWVPFVATRCVWLTWFHQFFLSSLSTHLWYPVCPTGYSVAFGMGPCLAHHFTPATIHQHFALHNHGTHAIHWAMYISPWQMQKHLYYSQSVSNFVCNFDLCFLIL